MADADASRTVRFGAFEVDLRAGELRKNGIKIKLQEQPFRVLVTLLEHAGDVVTREELRRELWPSDTFVDFEHGLNAAVKRLRDALGESAEKPIFVETLARRGYRFIARVDKPGAPLLAPPRTGMGRGAQGLRAQRVIAVTGVALAIVSVAGALNWADTHRWRIGASGKKIESLAVLPLQNLSHDPEQEYFSDGMTDALTTQLSKAGTLRVTSRTSAMQYKGTHKSLPEIAKELNVDGVIEGSVMRSGNRVRIAAQLVEASTDRQLWAETYERDLGDVLKLQSEVAQAVAQQVRMQVTPAQQARLHAAPTVDPQAYEAYLKGSSYRPTGTKAGIQQALAYFEQAVQRDPGFAPAYVGLADSYLDLGAYRWLAPADAYRHGSEAIHKALQLDEALGEAHSTLGYLDWQYAWDWEAAEREIRHAVDMNPSYIDGHITLVWYLAWRGRRDEALAEVQKIRWIDPAYPFASLDESGVYYHRRDYKSLTEAGLKAVTANPNMWSPHYFLAVGYEGSGQLDRAAAEYQRAADLSQRNSDPIAGLAHVYTTMGKRAEAEKILRELQQQSKISYGSPYMIAVIYSGLNQKDKAFAYLEKAYQEKSPDMAYFLRADLRIDGLRSDSRFQEICRRMGLPQ